MTDEVSAEAPTTPEKPKGQISTGVAIAIIIAIVVVIGVAIGIWYYMS